MAHVHHLGSAHDRWIQAGCGTGHLAGEGTLVGVQVFILGQILDDGRHQTSIDQLLDRVACNGIFQANDLARYHHIPAAHVVCIPEQYELGQLLGIALVGRGSLQGHQVVVQDVLQRYPVESQHRQVGPDVAHHHQTSLDHQDVLGFRDDLLPHPLTTGDCHGCTLGIVLCLVTGEAMADRSVLGKHRFYHLDKDSLQCIEL